MQIEKYWAKRELAKEGEVTAEVYDIVITSLNLVKLQHWAQSTSTELCKWETLYSIIFYLETSRYM